MGTWGIGHFENDSAADFSGSLDDAAPGGRAGLIRAALLRAAEGEDYLESDEGAEAVVAAALVAAQCPGGTPVTTAYGPAEPIPALPVELRPLAVEALDRVLAEESELAELWGEGAESEAWRQGIRTLRAVLVPVPSVAG
ncbi:DUF4259 domain-containing protein [Streptomyces rubellomurinus]|uniref:DUF4259 domain-containing protein n=2 Tax=Streptomyces TaxID=1883 RepID=A0A0F2T7B9_STRR3|nr:DUF4259 domain-containing protein [Streptomyces rubellomurinus]KJS53750.1 hypothetical protein VM98_23395 [Streptomyces rubellomurinus subsp. indigoferus]KJS59114.1 hypothetical protein VM95_29175 [Streptomyces rubellomurinus]